MSLYNTLRPRTLNEVVGQENVKAQLTGIIDSGNIPNAMLLTGPRGTGKTTIARIVARQLNCEKGGAEPCGECESCKSILNGTSMDVVELDAASNNKVEDVRTIIEKAQYAPISKYKVFILDEVHMFSQGAWNALLKLIEEPPKNVVFMLCTTEEHKVPATIISRCRKLYFEKIELSVVAEYLASICDRFGKAYDEDALKLIAQSSEGCMRDALSIMEPFFDSDSLATDVVATTLGAAQEDAVFGILNAISDGDASLAIQIVREQAQRGKNSQLLLKALVGAVTDTMFVLNGTSVDAIVNTAAYKELLKSYAEKASVEKCLELSRTLAEVYGALTKVPDALFLIESSLLRVVDYESRVSKLERRVATLENSGVVVKELVEDSAKELTQTDKVVSFPAGTNSIAQESKAVVGETVSEDKKYLDDAEMADFLHNLPIPVNEEEVSSMDLSASDLSSFGITEDEVPADFFEQGTSPVSIPSDSTKKVVDTKEETTAPAETKTPEPEKTIADGSAQITEDDGLDDLLAHLPKGTMVVTDKKPVSSSKQTTDNAPENAEPPVGETESTTGINNELPLVGFEGFSDWL